MKKMGYVLSLFLLLLMVTGCGNSKLKCTKNEDIGKQIVTFQFDKDGIVSSGVIRYEVNVLKEEIEKARESLEKTFKETFEDNGISVKLSDNGQNLVIVTLEFSADKLNTALGYSIDTSKGINEITEELVNNSYTCKTF